MSKISADAIASETVDVPEITEEAAGDLAAAASAPIGQLPPEERLHRPAVKLSLYRRIYDWLDVHISRLSVRNYFWHRVCSFLFLPLSCASGIYFKRVDDDNYVAVLPFRRFNRNWYSAMGGAALLANSEIAGGSYLFRACGADYTVVCKHLDYRFLRPCLGTAIYTMKPREDIQEQLAHGKEFNLTLDMEVVQQGERNRRVGRCVATFHVTPKSHVKAKGR
ncbi:MAG: hypothetical protein GX448_15545 [Planctomycetes bacterium]|nr:hypothetical protein [Planctomycetota bacterium]